MNRKAFVLGAAAAAATIPMAALAGMTWKGNIPLWDIEGEKVDVQFSYDSDCLAPEGITAVLHVPYGTRARLLADATPTMWVVSEWGEDHIMVDAVIPGGCPGEVGMRLVPRGRSSIQPGEDWARYGELLRING